MVFANPNYLYLLLLLIPMIGWYVYKLSKSQASLQVSSSEAFEAPGAVSWIVYLRHVPFVLRMVAVALLIVILARPQSTNSWSNSSTGRYRYHVGDGYLGEYAGARLETEPLGGGEGCGRVVHQRPSER